MVLHVTGVLSLIIFNDELKLIDSISIQLLLRLNAFKFLEKLIVPRKSLVKFLSELSSIFVIALQLLWAVLEYRCELGLVQFMLWELTILYG